MAGFLKFDIVNPNAAQQQGSQLVNISAIRKIVQDNGANPPVYTPASVRIILDVDQSAGVQPDFYGNADALAADTAVEITVDSDARIVAGQAVLDVTGTIAYGVIQSVAVVGAVTTLGMGGVIGTAIVAGQGLQFKSDASANLGTDTITVGASIDGSATPSAANAPSSTFPNLKESIMDALSSSPDGAYVVDVKGPIDGSGPILLQSIASTTGGALITTGGAIFGAIQVGDTVVGQVTGAKANVTAVNAGTLVLDGSVGAVDAAGNMIYSVISGSGKQVYWRSFSQA